MSDLSNVEQSRARILNMKKTLPSYFVGKDEIVDLMITCAVAQEPLLLIGKPGTAKSDLIIKFVQAIGVKEYFEYMLTKFTEPSEVIGPIDINLLKEGKYYRKVEGKLPTAKVAFLDEIFKSNSAILNTLLTIINEKKYYQEGKPVPVSLKILFAATNEIPDFTELDALKDRFTLKIESTSVRDNHFDALLDKGLRNEIFKVTNQKPWSNLASLDDFLTIKSHIDETMRKGAEKGEGEDRKAFFPDNVFSLFRRILRTLEKEERIEISDRKVIKLYRLLRIRAFLFHGGVVTKDDLTLLRYTANRQSDIENVKKKVDTLLKVDGND